MHNLYSYHCLLCTGKILKFHTLIALYALFALSRRKETLVLSYNLQFQSFASRASSLWNTLRGLPEGRRIIDFTAEIGYFKKQIKLLVSKRQKLGDEQEWHPLTNFSIVET